MLSRKQRLSSDSDIRTVLKRGAFVVSPYVKIVWKERGGAHNESRWVVVVSTKVDKRAVKRNLIRRIAQSVILSLKNPKKNADVVLFIKPKSVFLKKNELKREIISLIKKSGIA